MKLIGTREEVYYGLARNTSGGMTKHDIIKCEKSNKLEQYKNSDNTELKQHSHQCNDVLKNKNIYLSKKISTRMKHESPLIIYRNSKKNRHKSDCYDLNVSDLKDKLIRERKLERLKRRKLKSLRNKNKNKNKNKLSKNKNKLSKKLCFVPTKNKTRTYYCKDMFKTTSFSNQDGYKSDNENSTTEFKIEEPPHISIDELFL